MAFVYGPDAGRTRRRIATAAGHHHIVPQTPTRSDVLEQHRRYVGALDQLRQYPHRQADSLGGLCRPAPRRLVETPGAGRIRHVADPRPGQTQPYIILGQQQAVDGGEYLRLVAPQPKEFRQGEAGHRQDAEPFRQSGVRPVQFGGFVGGAAVVPQHHRPQRLVVGAQNDGAMHLAGKTDGTDAGEGLPVPPLQVGNRRLGRPPPILGVLFRPLRVRTCGFQRYGRLGKHLPVTIDQHGLDGGGTDIDPQRDAGLPISHRRARCDRHDRAVRRHAPPGGPARPRRIARRSPILLRPAWR